MASNAPRFAARQARAHAMPAATSGRADCPPPGRAQMRHAASYLAASAAIPRGDRQRIIAHGVFTPRAGRAASGAFNPGGYAVWGGPSPDARHPAAPATQRALAHAASRRRGNCRSAPISDAAGRGCGVIEDSKIAPYLPRSRGRLTSLRSKSEFVVNAKPIVNLFVLRRIRLTSSKFFISSPSPMQRSVGTPSGNVPDSARSR
ncbi:hypothetical protein FHS49_000306 [Sphingobium boeckii]|uniref:Uncharacterized protein n=1 Tax=Sphingobium boeckii TaxID=1082345 RepID=A0A7W9AEU5_9SPHN|nr:hypothetical protein [Sphingobium boeckii]